VTIIVGVNSGQTSHGKKLWDGGCCIIKDGHVLAAISEERVSRIKRDGGYKNASNYLFPSLNLNHSEVDLVVTSTCCETSALNPQLFLKNDTPWIECNHHTSHALQTFYSSPFEEAIVIVLDSGGNTTAHGANHEWWKTKREQQSYFIVNRQSFENIGADFSDPFESGIAEVYRAFTYFLGWKSSRFAGNTMALAGCGDATVFEGKKIFTFNDGKMRSVVNNNPTNTLAMIEDLLKMYGIEASAREPNGAIEPIHKDLAAWLQEEVEQALIKLVDNLIEKTGVKNICLSGGVAYNCKATYKIMQLSKAENVFVGTASGDQGQCFGNALYGHLKLKGALPVSGLDSPYLGPTLDISEKSIKESASFSFFNYTLKAFKDIEDKAASLLQEGNIIAWFQGRSEFGPRALGNRSILASPNVDNIKSKLNKIKQRDGFMPFAPAILDYKYSNFFCEGGTRYMTVAVDAKPVDVSWFDALVHVDNSARVQVVEQKYNERFYCLIESFYKKTGVPVVLNTSFNGHGEPIVESIEDALKSFSELGVDYLVIGDCLITKNNLSLRSPKIYINDKKQSGLSLRDLPRYFQKLSYGDNELFPRSRFLLYSPYIDWIRTGKKSTTVRYRKGGIDFPTGSVLPLFPSNDFSNNHSDSIGELVINEYRLKQIGMLSEEDACKDGFNSLQELQEILQTIYGQIQSNEYVSIYSISLHEFKS